MKAKQKTNSSFSFIFFTTLFFVLCAACQWGINDTAEEDADAQDLQPDSADGADQEADPVTDRAEDTAADDPAAEDPSGEDIVTEDPAQDQDGLDGADEAGCTSDGQCDDGDPCSGQETCDDDGTCRDGTPLPDLTPCTTSTITDGVCRGGLCASSECGDGTVQSGEECDDTNTVPGDGCEGNCTFTCHAPSDCDDSNVCTDDDCVSGGTGQICDAAFNTDPCNDGLFCTARDACDGAGGCSGSGSPCDDGIGCTTDSCDESADTCPPPTPDDASCPGIQVCSPSCTTDPSGCVRPPAQLDLACTSPVSLPSTSDCTIALDGVAGQSACLSCTTRAGMVVLDRSDFGDDTGSCGLDGWTLAAGTGNLCTSRVDGCNPRFAANCCATLATLCTSFGGSFVLRSDEQTNCGGNVEEFRITKSFDTTGIAGLELCFDYGEVGGAWNDGLIVTATDGTNSAQVYCLNSQPRTGVDGVLYPICVALPGWAGSNPSLSITFIVHSETALHALYLDDVTLKGWISTCASTVTTVLSEDFTGCGNPIADGWNGWAVTGTPDCPGTWNCSAGTSAQSSNDTWSITRLVNASALDGNVALCLSFGDTMAGPGDSITAEFDAQRGLGWQTAWSQTGNLGGDGTCARFCVNLSDINPDVNLDPALLVRFTLQTAVGHQIDLDDIALSGAVYCDGTGVVQAGSISDGGGGSYAFTATDTYGGPVSATVSCSWTGSSTPVGDSANVDFMP